MTNQVAVDGDRLNELLGRVIGDLGATTTAGGVVVGHRLGLYGALARGGPATPEDLAARTDTDARYVAEWLAGQAAGEVGVADDGHAVVGDDDLAWHGELAVAAVGRGHVDDH